MNTETYKNEIIGSGEGGKVFAWHLAEAGGQTMVVERQWIGRLIVFDDALSNGDLNLLSPSVCELLVPHGTTTDVSGKWGKREPFAQFASKV